MDHTVSIRLLGGFAVSVGARRVDDGVWRLRKARTLVKLLALEADRRVHQDRLCHLWWPDHDDVAGTRNNLHQVLHAARKALGTVGIDHGVVLRDEIVALAPGRPVSVDVDEFLRRARDARGATDLGQLEQVLASGRGELLPEDRYEDWVQPHRDMLRASRIELALAAARTASAQGQHLRAVEIVQPSMSEDELNEPVARTLMQVLAAAGRHAEALVVFERLREAIGREYGAVPDPRTRRLYRDLLAGSTAGIEDAPDPPASTGLGPHNLPVEVTELVGRDAEVEEICALLDRTRMLTVTGPGGAGKTRLALEVARRRLGRHPDGAWVVELAVLTRGALLAHQVATELGLTLPEQGEAMPALVRQLAGRRLLLVLDNCEHLIDSCARLADQVLRRCPGVVVLATSREPLRISGEVARRIPPLAVPGPRLTADQLERVAAVRLFVQRARAVTPDFVLTDANASAVAQICVGLDGMPLALELAAARLPMLEPTQIADRLDDALGVLGAGHRAAHDRQQTLRATLDWSYHLLEDTERTVFRRLGVFAGSFTLEALEGVCGRDLEGAVPARVPTLRVLGGLVDKSLVTAEIRAGGTRYRLLAPVRQYADELLTDAGEGKSARRRHLAWYCGFAARRDPADGADDSAAEFDAEYDDLRSALGFALGDDAPAALGLAVSLWHYWLSRGRFVEGARWLEEALAGAPAPSALRGRALFALAVLDVRRGSGERLAELGAQNAAIQRELRHPESADTLQLSGILAFMDGDWATARGRAEDCLDAGGRSDGVAASAVHLLAVIALSQGRLGPARELLIRSRDMLRTLTGTAGRFFSPVMLGVAVEHSGVGPRTSFEETVLQARRVGAEQASAYVHCNLAYLARLHGDLDEAAASVGAAVKGFTAAADQTGLGVALNHLGCLLRVRGEFDRGRAALREALRIREGLGDRRAVGLTTCNLGLLTAAAGDVAHGRDLIRLAATGFQETRDGPGTIGTLAALAGIALETGEVADACRHLEHAVARSTGSPGDHRWTGWMYLTLAAACRSAERIAEAQDKLRSAEETFAQLDAVDGADYCAKAPWIRELRSGGASNGTSA